MSQSRDGPHIRYYTLYHKRANDVHFEIIGGVGEEKLQDYSKRFQKIHVQVTLMMWNVLMYYVTTLEQTSL